MNEFVSKVCLVGEMYKRQKQYPTCVVTSSPTDDEVVAAVEFFSFLNDLAGCFNLELLSSWAVINLERYKQIAYARKIDNKIMFWPRLQK